jgi:hypothetical protein
LAALPLFLVFLVASELLFRVVLFFARGEQFHQMPNDVLSIRDAGD